ncbi:hypothetical protein F5X96DRAFT_659932 [Biscogniauxia mediterranea]|nr:hypothetical protein F5X96DRAFT_659932 [Biscogniauxia mediterranea]
MDILPYLPKEQQELILDGPALAPPANVTSNFDNPPNNDGLAHGVFAVCLFFATFSFSVRIYARAIRTKKLRVEDFCTIVAYGCYIGFIYCAYRLMAEYGYFIHQWDLRVKDLIEISYILHVGGVLYSVTLPMLKSAILLEWSRIFVPLGTRNAFWWICVVLIGIQLSLMVGSVVSLCLTCIPYQKIWDITLPGKCIEKSKVEITTAAVHLASDLVILSLPQKVIWTLQMSVKQKLGVSVIFSLGVLACVSAAFRLAVTIQYSTAADVIYAVSSVILWALAEMTCGFIVVGMPTAPKALYETGLATRIKEGLKSWTGKTNSTKSSTNLSTFSSYTPKSPNPSSLYQKIDENGMPLRSLKHSPSSESTEHLREYKQRPNAAIIRTTQVSTREDYDYNGEVGSEQFQRQHPWRAKK